MKRLFIFFLSLFFSAFIQTDQQSKAVAGVKPEKSSKAVQASISPESVDFSSDHWKITDANAKVEDYLGRKSLYMAAGMAMLKDVGFENGVIEVDIAAPNNKVSFVGLVFRVKGEGDYEVVYFRPHKSGAEDAVQYTPAFNGSSAWQLYSGRGFTTAVDIPKEQWVHARIEVSGLTAKIYFNNSDKPVLVVDDLKRGYSEGAVGLWAFANGGHFSNFTYKVEPVGERPQRKPPSFAAGIISKWELSDAFDAKYKSPDWFPADIKAMKWQSVEAEAPGMVVINRYRRTAEIVPSFRESSDRTGKREDRRVVFALTTVYSDSDQIRKMSLGYSDDVTVFLNSNPVFSGNSAFRFRDFSFLGIMDVEDDAVYLNLKKGRNEIVLSVADYFGGWGFIGRIDDMRGIRMD